VLLAEAGLSDRASICNVLSWRVWVRLVATIFYGLPTSKGQRSVAAAGY
jgi:hypothetical protein